MNRLPEKLTLLRKHFGYSQGDVAEKLNVPVTDYMKWENGNMIPVVNKLKELSTQYGISLDSLLDNTLDVTLPELERSVEIPFITESSESTKEINDLTGATQTETLNTDLGETKIVNTQMLQETLVTQIADTGSLENNEIGGETDEERKRRVTRLVAAITTAAIALVAVFALLLKGCSGGESSVPLGSVNRLALGDKYSLYIDKGGNLIEHGTFEPRSNFSSLVQVDAYGDHAVGVRSNGTVVTSDNNQDAEAWTDIKMAAAGRTHTVGLKSDGTVVCTGSNAGCQVSSWENIKAVYAGNAITIGITENGTVMVSGEGLPGAEGMTGIKSAAIGENSVLLIHQDGRVSAFATAGTPIPDVTSWTDIDTAAAGSEFAVGLRSDGRVVTASVTDEKMKKTVEGWSDIRYIDACGNTVIAVTKTGTLKGAGDNEYGQYANSGSDETDPEGTSKLDSPENITFSASTANVQIKWDRVEHADFYEVKFNPALTTDIPETAANSVSIPASSLSNGTTYTVTIIAHAKDTDKYEASDPSRISYTYNAKTMQLDSVTDIRGTGDVAGWHLEWSGVDHADYYIVRIDDKFEDRAQGTSYYMDLTGYEWADGSTHTVTVTAYSNSSTYTESSPSSAELQWNLPRYNVTINIAGGSQTIQIPPGTYTLAELLSFIEVPENFTVTDDIYTEFTITRDYGLTVNGKFEEEDNG